MGSLRKLTVKGLELLHFKMPVFNTAVKLAQDRALTRLRKIEDNSNPTVMDNPNPKKIVFNLVRGMYAAPIYVEAGLAMALKHHGHNVKLLTCDGALSACPGYFEISKPPNKWSCNNCKQFSSEFFDIVDLPYLTYAKYVDGYELSITKDRVNMTSIEDCKNFVYKDVNVGVHAITSTQRFFKGANPDKNTHDKVMRSELINAIISTIVAERVVKEEKPDVLVTSHSCYSSWGSFSDYFRNKDIRVCTYGGGYKKNTVIFERDKLDENFKRYYKDVRNKKFLYEKEREELKSFLNKRMRGEKGDTSLYGFSADKIKDIGKLFKITKYDKIHAMFTNVPWDVSLLNANNAFKDVYEWISYTIKLFEEKPELQLIIKIHPAEKIAESASTVLDYLDSNFAHLPENINVIPPDTKISPYSLFPIIDVGIVYNGTIGLEMVLNDIPVVVAGRTHYGEKGFTHEVTTKRGYADILFSDFSSPTNKNCAEVYAYFYFVKSFIPRNFTYYNNFLDLGWKINTLAEFADGKDKYIDHICDYIINGGIYQNW